MRSRRSRALLAAVLAMGAGAIGCGGAGVAAEGRDPELVVMEGELGNSFVPAGEAAHVVSRLHIDTRALTSAHRPPINLALVVDTSGSMEGPAIDHARDACLALLDTLQPDDRLAVVAFHSETETLLASTQLRGTDLAELRAAIGRMQARGTTDLAGGLRAGLEEIVRHYEPEGINRLVLLSDGVPNDAQSILPMAQAAGERDIAITALGLGLDYDETLLGQIAQLSEGRFHYIADSLEVASVFREEVLRFSRVLARNLVLELRPGPGVAIEGVLGQPAQGSGGSLTIPLGDLSEGDERDVIVRLNASPRRAGANVELMDAILRFDDAVQNAGRLERRVFLGARSTSEGADLERGRNVQVEQAAARTVAAMVTVEAIQVARAGDVERAREMLDRAAAQAQASADELEDERLQARSERMRVLTAALPSIAPDSHTGGATAAPPAPTSRPPAAVVREEHGAAMEAIQASPMTDSY
ncbi:MAG: VWA domain-containing protein [Sandaracinaceae bacterium]|nr:VWA domain-containing protein [Sandaracinaceae bacterium]